MRRLKDAVDKPFHPRGTQVATGPFTIAVPNTPAQPSSTSRVPQKTATKPTRVREPSPDWPEWDIDLDLNESDEDPTTAG